MALYTVCCLMSTLPFGAIANRYIPKLRAVSRRHRGHRARATSCSSVRARRFACGIRTHLLYCPRDSCFRRLLGYSARARSLFRWVLALLVQKDGSLRSGQGSQVLVCGTRRFGHLFQVVFPIALQLPRWALTLPWLAHPMAFLLCSGRLVPRQVTRARITLEHLRYGMQDWLAISLAGLGLYNLGIVLTAAMSPDPHAPAVYATLLSLLGPLSFVPMVVSTVLIPRLAFLERDPDQSAALISKGTDAILATVGLTCIPVLCVSPGHPSGWLAYPPTTTRSFSSHLSSWG